MDASLAGFQARLATFATTSKTRRTSTRSKKATAKSKIAWPHTSPAAQDLAYAGFVFRPTSASIDNVQCISCNCQLDGWEESDVPAHEHLTHSPNCGLAMFACIRLRNGDPGRVEEDPTSELMLRARLSTFGEFWPLDTAAGFPSIDQMAAAGWFYDPTEEYPDSVTCPYCSLSLDSWDAGDDPMEEHHRRESTCLFFTLPELLRKEKSPSPPPKKAKRTSTAKATKVSKAPRASTRSSGASITSKKATRGKKRASEAIDEPEISEPKRKASTRASRASTASTATKKVTRGKKRASEAVEESTFSEIVPSQPTKRFRTSSMSSLPDDLLAGTPKKPSAQVEEAEASDIEITNQPISLPEGASKKNVNGVSSVGMSSLSFIPPPMQYIPTQHEAPERQENDAAVEQEVTDNYSGSYPTETSGFPTGMAHGTPKWTPSFKYVTESDTGDREISGFPSDLPCGTPKKTPSHLKEPNAGTPKKTPSHFTMSSLPPDLLQGTPRRTPEKYKTEDAWKPIDIDAFFANHTSVDGFMNDILIDAGLDDIASLGSNPQDLYTAVMAGLTETEKKMSIEEWVLYNAKRGEEKLRQECEKQISAFEALGRQAIARIERMPTLDTVPAH